MTREEEYINKQAIKEYVVLCEAVIDASQDTPTKRTGARNTTYCVCELACDIYRKIDHGQMNGLVYLFGRIDAYVSYATRLSPTQTMSIAHYRHAHLYYFGCLSYLYKLLPFDMRVLIAQYASEHVVSITFVQTHISRVYRQYICLNKRVMWRCCNVQKNNNINNISVAVYHTVP